MNIKTFTYTDYLKCKNTFSNLFLKNKYPINDEKIDNNLNEEKTNYNLENNDNISFPHDKIYKMILSKKSEVLNLINQVLEIENPEYKITEKDIEIYTNSFVTRYMENRISDIIYKIKNKKIFFLIEHQSTIDYSMPFRIAEYCILIMKSAIDEKHIKNKNYKLPLVYPIVLYTGKEKWNHKKYLEENQEKLMGYKSKSFTNYNLIDINSFTKKELLKTNGILYKIMLLEKVQTEKELIEITKEITNANLEKYEINIFKSVLYSILSKNIDKKAILKSIEMLKINEGSENKMIIEEVIQKSREEEYKKGFNSGISKGLSQGISQERKKIIKQMIKINIKDKIILKITNISEKELKEIKKELFK